MALTSACARKVALALLLAFSGCAKPEGETGQPISASAGAESSSPGQSPAPALVAVNESLKAGSYDDAAARLLELQASGRNFTAREAADYRTAMNEAYTRALEAAEKGDARAEAAIKMIRAANSR